MNGWDSWEDWYGTDPEDSEFRILRVVTWMPIPASAWDRAVAEVDGDRGYTVEFASDPAAHRAEHEERAGRIVAGTRAAP